MNKVKIIYRKPVEAEYKELNVYDNLNDYLKSYNSGKDFVRKEIGNWKKLNTDKGIFYSYNGYNDEYFLTDECYKEMLKYSKKHINYMNAIYLERKKTLIVDGLEK
jgi:hypothetical protein